MQCYCDAYPFPHRAGGGKCNADSRVLKYFKEGHEFCLGCHLYRPEPDVASFTCLALDKDAAEACPALVHAELHGEWPK